MYLPVDASTTYPRDKDRFVFCCSGPGEACSSALQCPGLQECTVQCISDSYLGVKSYLMGEIGWCY